MRIGCRAVEAVGAARGVGVLEEQCAALRGLLRVLRERPVLLPHAGAAEHGALPSLSAVEVVLTSPPAQGTDDAGVGAGSVGEDALHSPPPFSPLDARGRQALHLPSELDPHSMLSLLLARAALEVQGRRKPSGRGAKPKAHNNKGQRRSARGKRR